MDSDAATNARLRHGDPSLAPRKTSPTLLGSWVRSSTLTAALAGHLGTILSPWEEGFDGFPDPPASLAPPRSGRAAVGSATETARPRLRAVMTARVEIGTCHG